MTTYKNRWGELKQKMLERFKNEESKTDVFENFRAKFKQAELSATTFYPCLYNVLRKIVMGDALYNIRIIH